MVSEQFDAFLLDLDGVVYLRDEALPETVESVNRFDKRDKELRFLTNDPRFQRETIADKLHKLGIDAEEDEIITSGWATARYLSQQDVTTAAVVGSEGLEIELQEEGIEVTDDDPNAMVVGADEKTSYQDIQRAARHIHRGATFVGTNPDRSLPTPDGPIPGAGAIILAIEAATGTEPTIVGKPEPLMFEMALDGLADDVQAAAIGDNPATDILGAHRAGLAGILVTEDKPTAASARDLQQPDMAISSLAHLFTDITDTWEAPPYSWPDEIRPGLLS